MSFERWTAIAAGITVVLIVIVILYECYKEQYSSAPLDHRQAVVQWFDKNLDDPTNVEIVKWNESVIEQEHFEGTTPILDGRYTGLTEIYVTIERNSRWRTGGRTLDRFHFIIKDGKVQRFATGRGSFC